MTLDLTSQKNRVARLREEVKALKAEMGSLWISVTRAGSAASSGFVYSAESLLDVADSVLGKVEGGMLYYSCSTPPPTDAEVAEDPRA